MKLKRYHYGLMNLTINGEHKNWYGTKNSGKDFYEFEKLVHAGYAYRQTAPDWFFDDYIYKLTLKGIDAVKNYKSEVNKMAISENTLMDFLEDLEDIEGEMNNLLSKKDNIDEVSDNHKTLSEAHEQLLKTIAILDNVL